MDQLQNVIENPQEYSPPTISVNSTVQNCFLFLPVVQTPAQYAPLPDAAPLFFQQRTLEFSQRSCITTFKQSHEKTHTGATLVGPVPVCVCVCVCVCVVADRVFFQKVWLETSNSSPLLSTPLQILN